MIGKIKVCLKKWCKIQFDSHKGWMNKKNLWGIYENEIICKVNPNEFNVSTNPTSVTYSDVPFDVNGDQNFDIVDVSYIYRYIMGTFRKVVIEADETEEVSNSFILKRMLQ